MALSTTRQKEIAAQLEVAATWCEGERKVILEDLAKELKAEATPAKAEPKTK